MRKDYGIAFIHCLNLTFSKDVKEIFFICHFNGMLQCSEIDFLKITLSSFSNTSFISFPLKKRCLMRGTSSHSLRKCLTV